MANGLSIPAYNVRVCWVTYNSERFPGANIERKKGKSPSFLSKWARRHSKLLHFHPRSLGVITERWIIKQTQAFHFAKQLWFLAITTHFLTIVHIFIRKPSIRKLFLIEMFLKMFAITCLLFALIFRFITSI